MDAYAIFFVGCGLIGLPAVFPVPFARVAHRSARKSA